MLQEKSTKRREENSLVDPSSLASAPLAKKVKILSEEDYLSAIDQIIERDYFPDLPKLRVMRDYLQARNLGHMNQANHLLYQMNAMTPATVVQQRAEKTQHENHLKASQNASSLLSLPAPHSSSPLHIVALPSGRTIQINLQYGLNDFFSKYTSEDNASFLMLASKEALYSERLRLAEAEQRKSLSDVLHRPLALLSGEKGQGESKTGSYLCLKDEAGEIEGEGEEKRGEERKEEDRETLALPRTAREQFFDMSGVSLAVPDPKRGRVTIQNTNTRFTSAAAESLEKEFLEGSELKRLRALEKADAKERENDMMREEEFTHAWERREEGGEGRRGEERRENYVSIPTSTPVDLFTWGQILSTPVPVKSNAFEIQESTKREQAAQAMHDRMMGRKKEQERRVHSMRESARGSGRGRGGVLHSEGVAALTQRSELLRSVLLTGQVKGEARATPRLNIKKEF